MYPIPSHLTNIFSPSDEEKKSEFYIKGDIRCTCGCNRFNVMIFANTEEGYPQICELDGNYALTVKIVCNDCGKIHQLFDISKHGWNGFVCNDYTEVADERLFEWHCPKCNCAVQQIETTITSQGKQDFIDEADIDSNSDMNEDDWVNAFEWIGIGLKCTECGYNDLNWIEIETM